MSYTIPIGPYHPSLEEPVHARLTVDGEQIKCQGFIGYNHRGIEKLDQERNFIQTDVLVERVCGICSHPTYDLCNVCGAHRRHGVPRRGQYIRRDYLWELERIHSTCGGWASPRHIIGHDSSSCTLGMTGSGPWTCWRPSLATG